MKRDYKLIQHTDMPVAVASIFRGRFIQGEEEFVNTEVAVALNGLNVIFKGGGCNPQTPLDPPYSPRYVLYASYLHFLFIVVVC